MRISMWAFICLCVFLIVTGILLLFNQHVEWSRFVLGASSLAAGILFVIAIATEPGAPMP